jgi:hypothetical protein
MRNAAIRFAAALLLCWFALTPAHAQAPAGSKTAAIMTVVTADGTLWALPENQTPIQLAQGLGGNGVVSGMAWNPARPELLLVRSREIPANGYKEGYDTLVRLDLASGKETTVYPQGQDSVAPDGSPGIGPQASLSRPGFARDGSFAYARISCCLSNSVVILDDSGAHDFPIDSFLPSPPQPPTPEGDCFPIADTVLGAAAGGQLIVQVSCAGTTDFYRVPRDYSSGQRIGGGTFQSYSDDWLGLSADGSMAILNRGDAIVSVDMAGGSTQVLLSPLPANPVDGSVAADGQIALAEGDGAGGKGNTRYTGIWVSATTELPQAQYGAGFPKITAYAWAPRTVISTLSTAIAP